MLSDSIARNLSTLPTIGRLVAALMISSVDARDNDRANTLELLCYPRSLSIAQVDELPDDLKNCVLVGYKLHKKEENTFRWCALDHTFSINQRPDCYFLTGLTAFPLPIWPFFNQGLTISPIEHLNTYLKHFHNRYHLESGDDYILVKDRKDSLIFSYSKTHISICVFSEDFLEHSLILNGKGCIISKVNNSKIKNTNPLNLKNIIFSQTQIDPLKYPGQINVTRENLKYQEHELISYDNYSRSKPTRNSMELIEKEFSFFLENKNPKPLYKHRILSSLKLDHLNSALV